MTMNVLISVHDVAGENGGTLFRGGRYQVSDAFGASLLADGLAQVTAQATAPGGTAPTVDDSGQVATKGFVRTTVGTGGGAAGPAGPSTVLPYVASAVSATLAYGTWTGFTTGTPIATFPAADAAAVAANKIVQVSRDGATRLTLQAAGSDLFVLSDGTTVATSSIGLPGQVDLFEAVAVGVWRAVASFKALPQLDARLAALLQWAGNPDTLIVGTVIRNNNGAAISAGVVWPDGTLGVYAATVLSSAFPGAVDAYTITYGSPATRTYTQPAVTRDPSTGAVTTRPAVTVS